MDTLNDVLEKIDSEANRDKLKKVFDWIIQTFPNLEYKFGWNQPMFINEGTFIIAFSVAKKHFSIAPEKVAIDKFKKEFIEAGYETTDFIFRIKWDDEVDFDLLKKLIEFNITDKQGHPKFWR